MNQRHVAPLEKIDQQEVMQLLGKSRSALYQLRTKDQTFPKPLDHMPLRWLRSHIESWLDSHNRAGAA